MKKMEKVIMFLEHFNSEKGIRVLENYNYKRV